jgi:hypothetical protein
MSAARSSGTSTEGTSKIGERSEASHAEPMRMGGLKSLMRVDPRPRCLELDQLRAAASRALAGAGGLGVAH